MFFPIFPWIFQIVIIAFAVIIGLYLASVGDPVNQVVRLKVDTSCQCTGAAQLYQDGSVCDPHVFNANCFSKAQSSVISTLFRQEAQSNHCQVAGCHFKEISSPKIVTYFQVRFRLPSYFSEHMITE